MLDVEKLRVDIAASEPRDIAQVILTLRDALVALLEEGEANRGGITVRHTAATRRAHQLVSDLDAGELLWPGWHEKAARFVAGKPSDRAA